MRRKATLMFAFCLSFVCAEAQRSILFKIKYLPERTYQSNVSMTSNIELNVENISKKDSDKLIKDGITMPMTVSVSTLSDLTIVTGRPSPQNIYPIVFRFNNVKRTGAINGTEMPGESEGVSGHELYATTTQTDSLHLDSISGKQLDTSLQKELTSTFDVMANELHLPEKTLKISDEFTIEIPFHMDMKGVDATIKVNATYKLTSIKKGLANFDIDQSSQLDFKNTKNTQTLTGKGGGHGEMIYDIKRNFPRRISRDLLFDYEMKYKDHVMKGKAKIVSFYLFSVTDNHTN
ncbi:MAG: hypothetical protein ACHQHN_03670 [Sphingobacteriales bacterium]